MESAIKTEGGKLTSEGRAPSKGGPLAWQSDLDRKTPLPEGAYEPTRLLGPRGRWSAGGNMRREKKGGKGRFE